MRVDNVAGNMCETLLYCLPPKIPSLCSKLSNIIWTAKRQNILMAIARHYRYRLPDRAGHRAAAGARSGISRGLTVHGIRRPEGRMMNDE